eukprot:1143126-Pelagomonas_calceolata.AAC.5
MFMALGGAGGEVEGVEDHLWRSLTPKTLPSLQWHETTGCCVKELPSTSGQILATNLATCQPSQLQQLIGQYSEACPFTLHLRLLL